MNKTAIYQQETICAPATPQGTGAIAVIRVSGADAIAVAGRVFKGRNLAEADSHTVHFGTLRDGDRIVDEVLVTLFRSPRSFTKEDSVEISCHGSDFIVREILKLLVRNGARLAAPGEFTQRAFLNGQFDLVQAEAVADLIAADSEASHRTALNQLRGGFSRQLSGLRAQLIHFASLVELELDFGEEDVEFAGRDDLKQLILDLKAVVSPLIESFDFGNAMKEGVPVAIIGSPNVGKSTLLNVLLNEEKAIVTSIAGTTRDVIEDTLVLGGVKFRIIDTAGIRETSDVVESMGIERSRRAMEKADVVIFLFDSEDTFRELEGLAEGLDSKKKVVWVRNKVDLISPLPRAAPGSTDRPQFTGIADKVLEDKSKAVGDMAVIPALRISAATGLGIPELRETLLDAVQQTPGSRTVVTNMRHYEHLLRTREALDAVLDGLGMGVTGDFLAQDIRLALHHLGEITGAIVTDDLLDNIFSKFCIGK